MRGLEPGPPLRRAVALAAALAAAAALAPRAAAQEPGPRLRRSGPTERIAVRTFTAADGLPQHTALALAEDAEGFVWVGTQVGVARWSGRRFEEVPLERTLEPVEVRALLLDAAGCLWVGTSRHGLLRRCGSTWQRPGGPGATRRNVSHLAPGDAPDEVYSAGDSGLERCRPSGCLPAEGLAVGPAGPLARDGEALWVATPRGLERLEGAGDARLVFPGLVASALLCAGGDLWAGTSRDLRRLRDGRWTVWDRRSGLPDHPVETIAAEPDGAVWAGLFGGGLVRIAPDDRGVLHDTRSGLPESYVYSLLFSPRGRRLWVGTASGGVARLDPERWVSVGTRQGLPHDVVVGIGEADFPDGRRSPWIGTIGGLARLLPDGVVPEALSQPEPPVVYAMATTRETGGRAVHWAATGRGLLRSAGGRWTAPPPGTLPSSGVTVLALLVEPEEPDALWVGTTNGTFRLRPGEALRLPGPPGSLTTLALAGSGAGSKRAVWVATREGVWRLRDGRADVVPCTSGVWANALEPFTRVDGRSFLWVGTSFGLRRLALDEPGEPCEVLTPASPRPLPDGMVYQVRHDRQGRTYVFTNSGVLRLSEPGGGPSGLDSMLVEQFGLEDGLPSLEFNRASWVDRDGRVWAGSIGGATVLDPRSAPPAGGSAPLVVLRASSGPGGRLPLSDGTVLDHRDASIDVVLSLLAQFREHAVRYRFQLAPLDAEPSAWSEDPRVRLDRIPAGRYVLRAWARDGSGVVPPPVALGFRVRPAPWAAWWAWLLYASAAVGASAIVQRTRLRAVAERARRLEREVEERTRELTEAREKLADLLSSPSRAAGDVGEWTGETARELQRALGTGEIAAFAVRGEGEPDGQPGLDLITGSPGAAPGAGEVSRLARPGGPRLLEAADRQLLAVTGLSEELLGLVVVSPPRVEDADGRRLLLAFARQLGGALEMRRLREENLRAAGRRQAGLRELREKGIPTLAVCPACGACQEGSTTACPLDGGPLEEQPLPRRLLGRYRFERLLGRGGMGLVLAARDERLERDVAVKLIRPDRFGDPTLRVRFEREARAVARVAHPGVVTIHDSGELEDGTAYLVMELLAGCDVGALVRLRGPGRPRQVARLVREASQALAAAHRCGIVHRDVKPENLFFAVGPEGVRLKVLDFGLAKSLRAEGSPTLAGLIVGTPGYMSPEQVRGETLDARSDVYSLAAVVWEALTGWPLVEEADAGAALVAVATRAVPPVSSRAAHLGVEVDEALGRALEKDPSRRAAEVEPWGEELARRLDRLDSPFSGWPLQPEELVRLGERAGPVRVE